MKFIKSYKLLLFLTFIFIFSSLFSILYFNKIELPNENWSKALKINTSTINSRYDHYLKDNMELFEFGDNYYLIYFSENSYYLNAYDEGFNHLETYKTNKSYNGIDDLNLRVLGDEISLNFITDNQLISLLIDFNGDIIKEEVIDNDVDYAQYTGHYIAYAKNNTIFLNGQPIKSFDKLIDFDFIKNGNNFQFSVIDYSLKTYKYDFNVYETTEKKVVNEHFIKSYALDNVTSIFDINTIQTDNSIKNMIITYNRKAYLFVNNEVTLSKSFQIEDDTLNNSKGYNFSYINENGDYLQNISTNIGRTEIASTKNFHPNVGYFDDHNVIPLTKTEGHPVNVHYYNFNQGNYLLFSEITSNQELSTYIASTNQSVISLSQKVSFSEIRNLIVTTLTTYVPLVLFGQIYSILFLVPIFIIILPLSLIKLTWAEQNQDKLLKLSIGLYLLPKLYYVIFKVNLTDLPIIFTNPLIRMIITLLFSSVAIYSTLKITDSKNTHYFKNFFIFFIIDMIAFTLFFTPYFIL